MQLPALLPCVLPCHPPRTTAHNFTSDDVVAALHCPDLYCVVQVMPHLAIYLLTALQLREREARLGELLDMVVEGYHTGFARSIQNYSQILQLFEDSRQQVSFNRFMVSHLPFYLPSRQQCAPAHF